MIGHQCIEQGDSRLDSLPDLEQFQSLNKIVNAECEKTHLEKGIKGNRGHHIRSYRIPDMI